MTMVAIDLCTV